MTFVTTVTTAICVFDVFTEMLNLLTCLVLSKISKQRSIVIIYVPAVFKPIFFLNQPNISRIFHFTR